MSAKTQYIIVFIILAAIVIWLVYSLVRKRPGADVRCAGCSLAETCKKKKMIDTTEQKPESCIDCPSTDECTKKNTFMSCGGASETDSENISRGRRKDATDSES